MQYVILQNHCYAMMWQQVLDIIAAACTMQVFVTARSSAAQTVSSADPTHAATPTASADQTLQQQLEPAVLLLHLAASLLQLRGSSPSTSPLQDSSGNVLCFNGEVFGGLDVPEGGNDGKCLLAALEALQSNSQQQQQAQLQTPDDEKQKTQKQKQAQQQQQQEQQQQQHLPALLSQLRGPWTLIYWQEASGTLWFGRDWLGEAQMHLLACCHGCLCT
jgi:hypothetical protein